MKTKIYKSVEDFSVEQIKKFGIMHKELKAYNDSLDTDNPLQIPKYSDDEMAEYSIYRELLIAKECEED